MAFFASTAAAKRSYANADFDDNDDDEFLAACRKIQKQQAATGSSAAVTAAAVAAVATGTAPDFAEIMEDDVVEDQQPTQQMVSRTTTTMTRPSSLPQLRLRTFNKCYALSQYATVSFIANTSNIEVKKVRYNAPSGAQPCAVIISKGEALELIRVWNSTLKAETQNMVMKMRDGRCVRNEETTKYPLSDNIACSTYVFKRACSKQFGASSSSTLGNDGGVVAVDDYGFAEMGGEPAMRWFSGASIRPFFLDPETKTMAYQAAGINGVFLSVQEFTNVVECLRKELFKQHEN